MEPLLNTLVQQTLRPAEIIIVDGAQVEDAETEDVVKCLAQKCPIPIRYVRSDEPGTAIQRNIGIDLTVGDFVALIDDDVRLEPDFFEQIMKAYSEDLDKKVGGVVGYRANLYKPMWEMARWRWYKRLRLFSTYEPGRYDYKSGYPINQNLHPPFEGVREVDFITTACAVWRRAVFDEGLRLNASFKGYAVVEDVHLSLKAGRKWRLLQCGSARCVELRASGVRGSRWELGYKKTYNYRYVFVDIVRERTWRQELRFWYVQAIYIIQLLVQGFLKQDIGSFVEIGGRLQGALAALRIKVA
jgi:glycosyltransferase involved in cell wall biosynthesis